LRELIEAKMKGLPITPREVSTPATVIDLMAALKRSLTDSPLEGRVRSEPVSEIGLFRAILDGNKRVLAPKIAKNRNPGA